MKLIRLLILFAFPVVMMSCGTTHKLPFYLENLTDSSAVMDVKTPDVLIQNGDLLSIHVMSISTKAETDELYNLPEKAGALQSGFLVDEHGDIHHHRLGNFHAAGATKFELAEQIRKKLLDLNVLTDPTVVVGFLNFKITILGQVGHEGIINIQGDRVNLIDAIGMAGGITDYGKKESVKIVRNINGKRQTGIVDLTNKAAFESPYFNLAQNDIVLVEPSKNKQKETDQTKTMQKISFALTFITIAASLSNIFIRN